jgi:zinc transporter ZupT
VINLQGATDGSKALVIASVLTGIVHVLLGILGTFVLKRFPTSFSVGFFLGVLVILANQNLIMFGTFHSYGYGSSGTNHAFANLALSLFCVLFFFTLLLFHFKKSIVVAPIDAKGLGRNAERTGSSADYHLDDA